MLIYWAVSDKVDRLLEDLRLDRESYFSSLHQEQLANHILEEILDHWYPGPSGDEPVWRHSPNPCSPQVLLHGYEPEFLKKIFKGGF